MTNVLQLPKGGSVTSPPKNDAAEMSINGSVLKLHEFTINQFLELRMKILDLQQMLIDQGCELKLLRKMVEQQ